MCRTFCISLKAAWGGVLLAALSLPDWAWAQAPVDFDAIAKSCAPDVHLTTLKAVVRTESAGNPFAIGVVGTSLQRQPQSLAEAVSTVRELDRKGLNFSMGLGQVNKQHLSKYGLTYESIFDPCKNLSAASQILRDCFERARSRLQDEQAALRAAFSCYYSGNFVRGFQPDTPGQISYVDKVVSQSTDKRPLKPIVPEIVDSQPSATSTAIPTRPTVNGSAGTTPPTPNRSASSRKNTESWVMILDESANRPLPSNEQTLGPVRVQPVRPFTAGPRF